MPKKYQEVKAYLLEQIQSGAYKQDEPIPPERELAASLGVNRMTLRRAVEELMYEGLLIRKKGSGTFLTKTKISKEELITADSEQDISVKVISCRLCTDGNYGFKVLRLNPNKEDGAAFWRLRRIRLIKMVPYAYEDIYLNPAVFGEVDVSFYQLSLHQIVKEKSGREQIRLSETVEALLCLHNTAVLLNVKTDSPILQIKSTFESEGTVILFCRSYHPGDTFCYRVPNEDLWQGRIKGKNE